MKRRTFIQGLLALVATPVIAKPLSEEIKEDIEDMLEVIEQERDKEAIWIEDPKDVGLTEEKLVKAIAEMEEFELKIGRKVNANVFEHKQVSQSFVVEKAELPEKIKDSNFGFAELKPEGQTIKYSKHES